MRALVEISVFARRVEKREGFSGWMEQRNKLIINKE
jgi:hypothetical protein